MGDNWITDLRITDGFVFFKSCLTGWNQLRIHSADEYAALGDQLPFAMRYKVHQKDLSHEDEAKDVKIKITGSDEIQIAKFVK